MKIRFLLIPLAVGFGLAQSLPQGVEKVTSVEGITEYKLANGLHVLMFPDPSKPTITVNMTYLVGSRHEGSGERGMAHLLEHMVFKGSPKHTDIPEELTKHGSRPNGTTSWDRTNYYETFQATDENLRWALDLESDRMVNSFIKKEHLEKEFTVVRNEFEMGENNPIGVLFARTLAAAYIWHNYGRSPIGNRSDIERVPIDRLQIFYKKFYQPDNAVLTVSGKIDEPKVLALVHEYFAGIPRPTRTLENTYTIEPTQDGERLVTLRRTGDIQGILAAYHVPAGADADFPAVEVLASLLSDNPSGRLHKALVDNKKAAAVIGAPLPLNEPGILLLGAVLQKKDSLDAARATLLETVDGVIKEPPSKDEVDRARAKLLKQIDLSLQNSETVGLTISEWLGMGDWRLLFLDRDRLQKVTPEDVQRVAKAYLKSSNRTIGEFIPDAKPDRAEVPQKPDVAAALKGFTGGKAMEAGEAFDSSPAAIDARTIRSTLPSGMKLALLPKKTRGASVHADITLHFGDLKSLANRGATGALTASTLIKGTSKKNRQQIQDELDRLKAKINISGGSTDVSASIETIRANLPDVLRLAAEVLREPSFPDTEFEQNRKLELTQTDFGKTQPQILAPTGLARHLYPYPKGDVRATTTPDEDIAELNEATLEGVKKFYREFYGASHAELAVAGDFDAPEIQKLAGELFGSWKSSGPFERLKQSPHKPEPVNQWIETPDKENSVFAAGVRFELSDMDADYPALTLANYMLGGGVLHSRLVTRIRVKDGLSYGLFSNLIASPKEKDGSFRVLAIAAPQNVKKVEAAFKEEMLRALKDGFADDEVATAKSGWQQSRQVNRSDDAALVRTLASNCFEDRTMAWSGDLEKKVQALTPAEIKAALARYINVDSFSIVKAGDSKKIK